MMRENNYFQKYQKDLFDGKENYIRISENTKISKGSDKNLLDKVAEQGVQLIKLCNINDGILTGADKVTNRHIEKFPKSGFVKGQGIYVLNKKEILGIKSKEFLKPFFKNSDIKKYYTDDKENEYLLYLTRDMNIENYIDIYNHVNKFEKIIKNRSELRGEIQAALKQGKWWVIFAARTIIPFTSPKIVAPPRSATNTFGNNEITWYAASDVFYITQKDGLISLKYVLAILNSKLYFFGYIIEVKEKDKI